MLRAIRQFFDAHLDPRSGQQPVERTIQVASAALLLETLRADSTIDERELEVVQRLIARRFDLDQAETDELIALAQQEVEQATDFYQFTSLVNRHFSVGQKNQIIEAMWRVAYADDDLSAHERHLVSKIAGLLHVTHGDYLAAQARARAAPSRTCIPAGGSREARGGVTQAGDRGPMRFAALASGRRSAASSSLARPKPPFSKARSGRIHTKLKSSKSA